MKIQRRTVLQSILFSGVTILTAQKGQSAELSHDEQVLFGLIRPDDIRGDGFSLSAKAADAFEAMRSHAAKDGIKIHSYSSYRSFDHQAGIFNRKYTAYSKNVKDPKQVIREIIKYSTIPGTSRHHWGTDLDMIDESQTRPKAVLDTPNFLEGGVYHNFYQWMLKHGNSYGFYEAYTNDPKRTGFEFEPWHWSFAEHSIPMLEHYVSLPLHEKLPLKDLQGHQFLDEAFLSHYKQNWGLGLNDKLIPDSIKKK
jgi:LAS superfamily LD-carboxypeptidase LdcB